MNKSKKIKLLFTSLLLFFITTPLVFAESKEWSLEVDWPAAPSSGRSLSTESGIAELVAYFYEWGILIGIIIFFGVLIYAGFKYLTSAGDPSKFQNAKKRAISGLSGVILLLGSYLILNAINPELTKIRKISQNLENVGSHEFSSGMEEDQNLCEFSFTTIQETEGSPKETYFLIPGLARKTEEVLPIKSRACTAEKDEEEILEVRENDIDNYWMLVEKMSGEEVKDGEELRVPFDEEDADDLYNLYKKRYEKTKTDITLDTDKSIYKTLEDSKYKNNYNLFPVDKCEDKIIGNEDFNRPRCLELDENGTLTEWRRIGYASLIKALKAIRGGEDFTKNLALTKCPSAEEMKADLGYKRDRTGGGCSIAFYDGEETNWFGPNKVTCSEQISKPSADMNTFDGLVDRETNCLELTRHEKPLDIELEEYRNKITLNNKQVEGGRIDICKGHTDRCIPDGYRVCNNNNDCTEITYLLPEGKYTVHGEPSNGGNQVQFENYTTNDNCQTTIRHSRGGAYDSGMVCHIELDEDKEFILEEK
ncbi:MAG: pilin [Patescibacteria group bacterium]